MQRLGKEMNGMGTLLSEPGLTDVTVRNQMRAVSKMTFHNVKLAQESMLQKLKGTDVPFKYQNHFHM